MVKEKTDKITRVDKRFNEEIEDIKEERIKRLIDITPSSTRKLTSLIPKHNLWKKIKKDIINLDFKKEWLFLLTEITLINYKYYLNNMGKIIVKVRVNKKTNQKTVTIPKEEKKIKKGDHVLITKVKWIKEE